MSEEATPKSAKTPRKNTAFLKPLTPSPALAVIIGSEPLARTEATKQLWVYIKAHNLQNPERKQFIRCDAAMKAVMGKDEVSMFEMTGLLGRHLS